MTVNTKDKYYTPEWLVKHTVKKAVEIIGKENITDIIEPSAGDGAFIEELDKLANELGVNVGYYDLYPSHPRIVKMDYKKLIKSYKKGRLIIGNPPFGTSSSLWKAFCKKSAKIGDYIAFISPASQYKSNYDFKEGEAASTRGMPLRFVGQSACKFRELCRKDTPDEVLRATRVFPELSDFSWPERGSKAELHSLLLRLS